MNEKTVVKTVVICGVCLILLSLSAAGFADCPDRVTCYMKVYNGFTYDSIWKGNITTPTCWKVGHQCKPWNCGGNTTDADYWVNECIRRFDLKAKHKGEQACMTIPMVNQAEKSLNGYSDHCNELPFTAQ